MPKTIDPEFVFELLRTITLATKTVSNDDEHLNFILNQLKYPKTFRPLKQLSEGHDRELRYDTKTGEWHERKFENPRVAKTVARSDWSVVEHQITSEKGMRDGQDRELNQEACLEEEHEEKHYTPGLGASSSRMTALGQPKDTIFSKKTSVTLLPPHGKTGFYKPKHGNPIGLLFNIHVCHLKSEQFIFPKMANTDERWWLHHIHKKSLIQKSTTLKELQEILRLAALQSLHLPPNELLIGLSKKSLVGVFTVINTRKARVEALLVQQKIVHSMKLILPIFIINQEGMRLYSSRLYQEDLRETRILGDIKLPNKIISPFLQEITQPCFNLGRLGIADQNSISVTASFLSLLELGRLAQTNHFFRSLLSNQTHLWRNSVSRIVSVPTTLQNKRDVLLHRAISLQPKVTLDEFARQNPENAYQLMESKHFFEQLPEYEKRLTSPRSKSAKLLNGFLGGGLGFFMGLYFTFLFFLESLLRTLIMLVSFMMLGCFFKTSSFRSFLGCTLYPLYSLCASVGYGIFYGWNYGLDNIKTLREGLIINHWELYYGTQMNTDEFDPWTTCYCYLSDRTIYGHQRTHIPTFFKTKNETVADIAEKVRHNKPQGF